MPFYQFNSFTGRLSESTRLEPLYPISPKPLNKAAEPVMIYDTVKTMPAKSSVGQRAGFATLSPKFVEACKKFQVDIYSPVYLLGGPKDKALALATTALISGMAAFGLFRIGQSL